MENKKIKVLLVDDQAIVLDILKKGLAQDAGIEVIDTANDGYLALNSIQRNKPDVIILDMEMPRMNGIQFLHNLMPINPIPTIVLSALTEKNSKLTVEAFEAGAIDFVLKPSGGAKELTRLFSQLRTKIRIAITKDVAKFKKSSSYALPGNAIDRTSKTNQIVLGMGAYEVITEKEKLLKIFALGSCIGLAMFCPSKGVIGMAHVVLPSSKTDLDKSLDKPGYFADTALKAMLDDFASLGCTSNMIYAKIAGGAKTKVELGDRFSIGQKNAVAVKAGLIKYGVKLLGEDIGGNISRTVYFKIGDKKLTANHPEKGNWLV